MLTCELEWCRELEGDVGYTVILGKSQHLMEWYYFVGRTSLLTIFKWLNGLLPPFFICETMLAVGHLNAHTDS